MVNKINLSLYQGNGIPINQREETLPDYEPPDLENPENYIADKGLRNAVNVAIALGQPLLVTGEPGTGKTLLAGSIAHELGLSPPLEFHTKTASTANDLFYQYDALRRFQDSHITDKVINIENYITCQAFGIAVLLTQTQDDDLLPEKYRKIKHPTRSVVLIDEIDKAPRDFPNDLLNELEKMEFTVKETGRIFKAEKHLRPILILTSNSEKNLPDAFLRRCIFYHIPFPSEEDLKKIVQKRFKNYLDFKTDIDSAVAHFFKIREMPLKKKPATAEFLTWLWILNFFNLDVNDLKEHEQKEHLALSYTVLAKTREDLLLLKERIAV